MSREQDHLELLRRIYAAYGQGDPRPMFDALAEDCVFQSMEPSRRVRFGSAYTGKAGFMRALEDMAADWELVSYRATRMFAEGDEAVVLADVAFRHRATGALVELDKIDCWHFRDGRVVGFKEYYDTLKADAIVERAVRRKRQVKTKPETKRRAKAAKPNRRTARERR